MVGNSYSPSPSSRAQEALEEAKDRIQDMWEQRRPPRPETVRKAGLLAIVAAAAAALLIIPQPDDDPAAEAYALQALAEPGTDGDSEGITEPTYEVADQPLENPTSRRAGRLSIPTQRQPSSCRCCAGPRPPTHRPRPKHRPPLLR